MTGCDVVLRTHTPPAQTLTALGANVEFQPYTGMGHSACQVGQTRALCGRTPRGEDYRVQVMQQLRAHPCCVPPPPFTRCSASLTICWPSSQGRTPSCHERAACECLTCAAWCCEQRGGSMWQNGRSRAVKAEEGWPLRSERHLLQCKSCAAPGLRAGCERGSRWRTWQWGQKVGELARTGLRCLHSSPDPPNPPWPPSHRIARSACRSEARGPHAGAAKGVEAWGF